MNLSLDHFELFHRAVHGHRPFEWQDRLLRKIVAEHVWPRVLDLPTGSGKTTCIDIALFALALDASAPPPDRWCPRRIAMVVDRRIVVDQAADRGRRLLNALTTSTVPEVVAVRNALASLTGPDEEPLGVFTLRGGIPKDDGWARTPDQALVIASTVDQLGSRLLIQGYGVSPGMRPVHAGLSGNDILILLDEVHLSHPFKQTLERLNRLRERHRSENQKDTCKDVQLEGHDILGEGRTRGIGLPHRFQFAFLSATPGDTEGSKFELLPTELAHDSELGSRLYARKPTRITEVSGREDLAKRIVIEARDLTKKHDIVAVVVNRVDTALSVFGELRKTLPDATNMVLLTGRMRPLDRDDVLAVYQHRIEAGRRCASSAEGKLVIVGTQCIEAGADFDFDAMVTESAAFDSLRQRFGRVDRLGEYKGDKGNGKAEGVIVHDEAAQIPKRDNAGKTVRKDGQMAVVKGDPIYADKIIKTVKWLKARRDQASGNKAKACQSSVAGGRTIDFGTRSLLDAPADLMSPKESAPMLLPAYLDLWSQTAPEPFTVPEAGLFLHGLRRGPEDVQVIWRADLNEAKFQSKSLSSLIEVVAAVRPSSLEAMSLPFVVARGWLAQMSVVVAVAADLEVNDLGQDEKEPLPGGRPALRWRGDRSEIVDASQVRPGDTLIVPSSYGGICSKSKCFDQAAMEEVPDIGERASLMGRGQPLLRLHPRVLWGLDLDLNLDDAKAARSQLAVRMNDLTGWKQLWARRLAAGRQMYFVTPDGSEADGWLVISGQHVKARELRDSLGTRGRDKSSVEEGIDSTTEDEDSPYAGSETSLHDHTQQVEERVRGYGQRLGFSENLVKDLSLAAYLHDIGKADWRFQCMLRGGSLVTYYRDQDRILAKSRIPSGSKAERRKAQRLSGYPRGARHEVQSVAMMEAALEQIAAKGHNIDLVMHLVASHHGHCRPFAPAIEDPTPTNVSLNKHKSEKFGVLSFETSSAHKLHRLDSAVADRFWLLVTEYGWLELCWLETTLRLADHRASQAEAGA